MAGRSKAEKKDTPRKDDESHPPVDVATVREWLKGLCDGVKERVVSKTDAALSKLIRDMASHPGATKDKGYFHEVSHVGSRKPAKPQPAPMGSDAVGWVAFEPSSAVYDHLPAELWSQVGIQPAVFQQGCSDLLEQVRICDGVEEHDTLTLQPAVIRDSARLFALMQPVTFGAFLQVPAQLRWCAKRRRWRCLPLPAFSCLPLFNLSMFVAHELEKAIWECFMMFSTKPASIPELLSREIETFWSELSKERQQELLDSLQRTITSQDAPWLNAQFNSWKEAMSPKNDAESAKDAKSDTTAAIGEAVTSLSPPEYLFYSPLDRFALPELPRIAQMKLALRCARAASIEESLVSSDMEAQTKRGKKKKQQKAAEPVVVEEEVPEPEDIQEPSSSDEEPFSLVVEEVDLLPPRHHRPVVHHDRRHEPAVKDHKPETRTAVTLKPMDAHRRGNQGAPWNQCNTNWSRDSNAPTHKNTGILPGGRMGFSGGGMSLHSNFERSTPSNAPPKFRVPPPRPTATMAPRVAATITTTTKATTTTTATAVSTASAVPPTIAATIISPTVSTTVSTIVSTVSTPASATASASTTASTTSAATSITTPVPPTAKTTAPPRPATATSVGLPPKPDVIPKPPTACSNASVAAPAGPVSEPVVARVAAVSAPIATPVATVSASIATPVAPVATPVAAVTAPSNGIVAAGPDAAAIPCIAGTTAATPCVASTAPFPAHSPGVPTVINTTPRATDVPRTANAKPMPVGQHKKREPGSPPKYNPFRSAARNRKNEAWYSDWFCSPQVAPIAAKSPVSSPPSQPAPCMTPPVLWLDLDMEFGDLSNRQNLQNGYPEAHPNMSDWQTSTQIWDRPPGNFVPDSGHGRQVWQNSYGGEVPPEMNGQPEQFLLFPRLDRNMPRPMHMVPQMRQDGFYGPPRARAYPVPAEWDKLNEEVLSLSKQLKQALTAKADEENMHRMQLQVERNQFADQLMLYRDIHQGCLDQIEALKRERDFFQNAHQQTLNDLRAAQKTLDGLSPPEDEPQGEPLESDPAFLAAESSFHIALSEDECPKSPEKSELPEALANPRPNCRRGSKELRANVEARQRTSQSTPPEPRSRVPRLYEDAELPRRPLVGQGMFGPSDSCPNFSTMDLPEPLSEDEAEATEQPPVDDQNAAVAPLEPCMEQANDEVLAPPLSPSFMLVAERSASVPQSPHHIRTISKRVRSLSPPPVRSDPSMPTVYKTTRQQSTPMRKLSWPRSSQNPRRQIPGRQSADATHWKADFLAQEWPPLSVNKPVVSPNRSSPTPPEALSPSVRQMRTPPADDSDRELNRRQRATSNPENMMQDWIPLHRSSTTGSARSEDPPQGKARARSARRVKGVTLAVAGVSLPSSRPRFGVASHFTRSRMGFVAFDDPLDLVQDMSERKMHDRAAVYRAQEAPYMLQSLGHASRVQPPPWADHHEGTPEGVKLAHSQLHAEIKKFDRYVTRICTVAEVFVQHVIDKIKRIVAGLWTGVEIKKYGSFATGLWLPCSDVDLVIVGGNPGHNQEGREVMSGIRSALHSLACELGKRKWVESVRVINNTAVPVIKMIGCRQDTKVMVDITYCPVESSSPHTGLQSNHLIRHYISALPELRPLALVLKQFLFEKGLSQTYTGGLSSYCLVLMLVSFLQSQMLLDKQGPEAKESPLPSLTPQEKAPQRSQESPDLGNLIVAPREDNSRRHSFDERDALPAPLKPRRRHSFTTNEQAPIISSATTPNPTPPPLTPRRRDLGKLLLGFLELYGRRFNYRHVGIAPQLHTGTGRGCYYTLESATTTLVINDPLDPQGSLDPTKANNIGKGVFAMYRVKAAFDYAFSILSVPSASSRLRRIIDGPPLSSIPMSLRPPLQPPVELNAPYSSSPSLAASAASPPAPRPARSSPTFFTFASHPTSTTPAAPAKSESVPSTPTCVRSPSCASSSSSTTPVSSPSKTRSISLNDAHPEAATEALSDSSS